MLKAGLEALARLSLDSYRPGHEQEEPHTEQQRPGPPPQEPAFPGFGGAAQGPLPLHELPSDVLGRIVMVRARPARLRASRYGRCKRLARPASRASAGPATRLPRLPRAPCPRPPCST